MLNPDTAAARDTGEDFDWRNDDGLVVVQRQDAIAVYLNPAGDIAIRREADWNEDDDALWSSARPTPCGSPMPFYRQPAMAISSSSAHPAAAIRA